MPNTNQPLEAVSSAITNRTEADAVIEQTLLGVAPHELIPGRIYAIRTADGLHTLNLTEESTLCQAGEVRLRPRLGYTFYTVDSFTSFVNSVFEGGLAERPSFPKRDAVCIAEEGRLTIRVIFDAQPYQWQSVIADLMLLRSSETERWLAASGKYMPQQDFAEFCELNLQSFSQPSAATILEIAQTFQAKTTTEFASATRLSNGAIKLKREETVNATAGERADISIPEELTLALPIFKYGRTYAVRARLRYRIVESSVRLSVLLIDPEMAIEHAFQEALNEVAEALQMPAFYGILSRPSMRH